MMFTFGGFLGFGIFFLVVLLDAGLLYFYKNNQECRRKKEDIKDEERVEIMTRN